MDLVLTQAAWTLKTQALTGQVYVDEVEVDEEGIAEVLMDDNVIANVSRPGTSLRKPGTSSQSGPSPGVRFVYKQLMNHDCRILFLWSVSL